MQAENAKHAAEMLKRSGELAGTAAEMLAGGAAGEAVQQLLEQAQNLASSALELLGQYTAGRNAGRGFCNFECGQYDKSSGNCPAGSGSACPCRYPQ